MPEKIIVAPDSFKGTMSYIEVCDIIESGIKNIYPSAKVIKLPIADGGEGTVDAFLSYSGGRKLHVRVKDPLFREVASYYGILPDGTAVIEMAAASGLPLVEKEKNPCGTTTFGTGQLISDALDKGCRRLIIGVGGSATNDGGVGMAAALGVRFTDVKGDEIPLTGAGLEKLEHIDVSGMDRRIRDCEILVACDVNNPLYGENGAAYVFAPQKGADSAMVEYLDRNLRHFSDIVSKQLGMELQGIPGAGAAGGLAAGLLAFAGARLVPGIELIMDYVAFDDMLKNADMVITGEGKIDGQSLAGKVPVGIAQRAKKYGVPVIAVVGFIGEGIEALHQAGIQAVFSTARGPIPYELAVQHCREDLLRTTEMLMRYTKSIQA